MDTEAGGLLTALGGAHVSGGRYTLGHVRRSPGDYLLQPQEYELDGREQDNNEENALGYSVYFYARNMYQKPGLKFMAVNGVMPDKENIKEGTYPYVNEFYAAVREDEPEDSPAYQLFQWLTTEDGQALVESVGYVGVGETKSIQVDRQVMEDPAPGTVTLREKSRVLLDGDYAKGVGGVLVLGRDLVVKEFMTDKRINSSMVLLGEGEPVPLIDEASEKTQTVHNHL